MIRFPSWRDVGMPSLLPSMIRRVKHGYLLNFLVHSRIFLTENKVQYLYLCSDCLLGEHNVSYFHSVTECNHCGSKHLRFSAYHSLGRKSASQYSSRQIDKVCSLMAHYHQVYIGDVVPDVMKMSWQRDRFVVKFAGGSEMSSKNHPDLAIVRAALACPFLWDGKFDLRTGNRTEGSKDMISHTIYEWCQHVVSSR
jgi:hypothetical protein